MNKVLFASLILLAGLGIPSKVLAHAVETNYLLSSDLEIKSNYSTGEPLEKAEVVIYAPNNPSEPWMVGNMDEQGRFSFMPDLSIPGDWEVQINQEGHEDFLTIPVKDKKIEVDEISKVDNRDIHYASIPLESVGAIAAVAGIGAAFIFRHRQS